MFGDVHPDDLFSPFRERDRDDRASNEEIEIMKMFTLSTALLLASGIFVAHAEPGVRVGGQAMFPSRNIVANAVNSSDHTTLVAAVKAAGLAGTLAGAGPFTVFAPTNAAFASLPTGQLASLLEPANKDTLVKILTYHVVSGSYDTTRLRALILAHGGSVSLPTVAGGALVFAMNGSSNITIRDAKGDVSDITISDVRQSNGVIHVIDRVLIPG